jgi:response regulator of citrate/malate metabolism
VSPPIRVLVVEDDPLLAQAHRELTERTPGFVVAGVAGCGSEALRAVATRAVDVVLLDINLPDMTGLDVCRALRARGSDVDVIAVTSARDLPTVRSAVSLGVTQYLLKPFTFATFREKLAAYAEYRRRTAVSGPVLAQDEVDAALSALHDHGPATLPKGLAHETLTAIVALLSASEGITSAHISDQVGISRATARRYLDYLSTQRLVTREPRYGGSGRPENVYRWSGARN